MSEQTLSRSKPDTTRVAHWPRLTRFYGVSPVELQHWPGWLVQLYTRAIDAIEAHELEMACMAADHPYMDDRVRERMHRSIDRRQRRVQPVVAVQATSDEGAAIIGALGIGVHVEKLER